MNRKLRNTLFVLALPTVYAVVLRLIYGMKWNEVFEVMSWSFLFVLPVIMGALTVYYLEENKAKKWYYMVFAPWLPVLFFLVITLVLYIEGWACWLMILPIFLVGASIGGVIGWYFKSRKSKNKMNISVLVLLPFLLSPLEAMIGSIPATYEAYSYIDISASADKIWDQVTRVKEIKEHEDSGWLNKALGLPRPVRAELDFEGVGGYRQAVFTKGLVFHETVTEYEDNKRMVFEIKALPHEIPSTALDEHVVIGGDYFDVLSGCYELEDLGNGMHRLHLSSRFELNTTFNFYSGWWAKSIMLDIQDNILQIEKKRAERP